MPYKKSIIAFAMLTASIIMFSFKGNDRNFLTAKNLDIFNAIYKELDMFYVDTIDPNKTVRAGIDAMLMELDPYTNYFPEEEMNDFKQMVTGKYGGIGSLITFHKGKNRVAIAEPFENTPASKAGLKAGDLLLELDGKDLLGKKQDEVSNMLRGEIGTTFTLKVERPGQKKPLKLKITRESIQINPVPYYGMASDSVGYIVLTSFTDNSAQEVQKAFMELKQQGINSLILDLRNNGGGVLGEAVEIVNFFIPSNEEVVSTRGKIQQWNHIYKTTKQPLDQNIPLTVLVNSTSASASEIVAGSLQDLDRAVIMGTRTFGKGLVQTSRELPYNSSLKITTAKYYIPSGRCIQAIDYTHRNEDGSVGRIPDSLTTVFHTRAGREVRDGGGIMPDKEIKNEKMPNILFYLTIENLIFDYATNYCLAHTTLPPVSDFELSEQDYANFKAFVKKSNFKYDRQSEKILKNLKEMAEFEGYMDDAKSEFESLEKKLNHNLDKDLDYFAKEIKQLIADEIVTRYYFQRGAIQQQLKTDKWVKEAVQLLKDTETYQKILSKTHKAEQDSIRKCNK